MWFISVEVEQETSAPPPIKNTWSAPVARPMGSRSCAQLQFSLQYSSVYSYK